ncbi:fumarylacetoacetate hydrolase family protein [Pyruvatibacter sp.]|uniref:fumarylacetoacetate hydrolase family protein n=1 Tax=Pyruvatibacter sp. TaxID=1981328 RepID=UPI003264EE2A
MRLYTTDQGICREATDGSLELLDINQRDLGSLLANESGLASAASAKSRRTLARGNACPLAPVPRPGTVFCVGANYESHLDEVLGQASRLGNAETIETTLATIRTAPIFFSVPTSAVSGPIAEIVLPSLAPHHVDYEVEVAVVIGKGGKNIDAREALDAVAGLTLANDVSARDIQAQSMSGYDMELGHAKGMDGFKPMGPCLVTLDSLPDLQTISLETRVNGNLRQSASLSDLIHDIPTCVAHISKFHTLRPGDVILTGSPAGVGFFQDTFLKPGDVVEMKATGIGELRNQVVAEAEQVS